MLEFHHFDIQSTGQKSHCVSTFKGHRNALFSLNSRIPLVRSSSELVAHCTGKAPESIPYPAIPAMRESTIHQKASSSFCSARTLAQGPLCPTLRANPFPEVTDLFCRLPLPTLFYRPEAANLGDLLRILVRLGVRIKHSLGVSRVVESAPDASKNKTLYPPFNPISR